MKSKWYEYVLSDLGEIKTGKTPPSSVKDAFGGHIPFVTPKDMTGSKWVNATERSLSGLGLQTVKNYRVPPRSVAVSCIGSDMGKVVLVAKESVTNQQINTIVVNEKLFNAEYIYYELSQRQEELKSIAGGSATPILNKGHFSNISIRLPDKQTQDVIVDVLRSLDDKIDLNRQTNQTLEQIAQAIFKSWFVDFDPVRAKIAAREAFIQQHPEVTEEAIRAAAGTEGDTLAHAGAKACELAAICTISGKTEEQLNELDAETLQQLKATAALFPDALMDLELGEVPEGWLRTQLSDFVSFQNGYAFKSRDWKEEGIPVVKIGSIKPGLVDLTNVSYVSSETVINLERFRLQPGDMLVGMSGYPGETGLVPMAEELPYLNQRVGRISAAEGNEKYYGWIYCLLRDPEFKKYAESRSHGSAQANVSGSALVEYVVTFSSRELLESFNDLVKPITMNYLTLSSESEKLKEIRDELLPSLLAGKVDA